jgi:hypothetical protein
MPTVCHPVCPPDHSRSGQEQLASLNGKGSIGAITGDFRRCILKEFKSMRSKAVKKN